MISDFYKENGYYIAKNLISKDIINDINKDIKSLLNSFFINRLNKSCNSDNIYENFKFLFDYDPYLYGEFVKMTGVISRIPSVHRIQFNSHILDILKQFGLESFLIPTGPAVHVVSGDMRLSDGYFGVEPHQDWPSMQGSLDSLITWIPLNDVSTDNYPLEIVPGSNKEGLIQAEISLNCHIVDKYSENDFMPVEVQVGDVVFMSSFTVHRTGLSGRENSFRAAVSYRYDNAKEPFFVSNLYPTAYRRIVDREIKLSNVPTNDDIKKIFRISNATS